jgi:hypothetical protein
MSSLSGAQYIECSKELALPLGGRLPLFTELPTERAHPGSLYASPRIKWHRAEVLWTRHIILAEKITTRCGVVCRFGVLEEQRVGSLLLGMSCSVVSPSHGGYTLLTYEDHCCRASFVFTQEEGQAATVHNRYSHRRLDRRHLRVFSGRIVIRR